MKTNKAFAKRFKVLKSGKVLARKPGQNHFNAKESGKSQINKKGLKAFHILKKDVSRFIG